MESTRSHQAPATVRAGFEVLRQPIELLRRGLVRDSALFAQLAGLGESIHQFRQVRHFSADADRGNTGSA
jgi:hypothetical protein